MSSSSSGYDIALLDPNTNGYVVVSIQSDPESVASSIDEAKQADIGMGTRSSSPSRLKIHDEFDKRRPTIAREDGVLTINLFEAIYFDRGTLDRHAPRGRHGARVARYDNVLIAKTQSDDRAERLLSAKVFEALLSSLRSTAQAVDVLTARNAKRAGDVDRSRAGVFLINYFFAEDLKPLLDVWDHTAGWWSTEGQMANSELLRPSSSSNSDYAIINTARWDGLPPAMEAFSKDSYGDYVLANIDANRATTMPALYRLVA